jgi:O-antigen ligase
VLSLRPPLEARILLNAALLAVFVCGYAAYGLAQGHSLRLVVWDGEPYLEFGAYLLIASLVIRTAELARRICIVLVVGAAVKALYDLGVFAADVGTLTPSLTQIESHRIVDAVPFLLVPVGLFLSFASNVRGRQRLLLLSCSVVTAGVLVLTFTRTYWLGLAAGLVVAMCFERGPATKRLLILIGATLLLFSAVAIVRPSTLTPIKQRASYTIDQLSAHPGKPLEKRRQVETRIAWKRIRASHFLGTGLGATIHIPLSVTVPWDKNQNIASLHIYFLQVLLKLGLLGFLVFLALCVQTTAVVISAARQTSAQTRTLAAGLLALWIIETVQLLLYSAPTLFHVPAFIATIFVIARLLLQTARTPTPSLQ